MSISKEPFEENLSGGNENKLEVKKKSWAEEHPEEYKKKLEESHKAYKEVIKVLEENAGKIENLRIGSGFITLKTVRESSEDSEPKIMWSGLIWAPQHSGQAHAELIITNYSVQSAGDEDYDLQRTEREYNHNLELLCYLNYLPNEAKNGLNKALIEYSNSKKTHSDLDHEFTIRDFMEALYKTSGCVGDTDENEKEAWEHYKNDLLKMYSSIGLEKPKETLEKAQYAHLF